MTALLPRVDNASQWGSMPGWNIVGDLTPPELINARRVAVLRRRIIAGLVLVVLLCAGGYAYTYARNGSASDDATAVAAQTVDLTRSAGKYGGITKIENAVNTMRTQVAGVMTQDVDVAHLVASIRAALPSSMSIQNLAVTLTGSAPASSNSAGLDASGHPKIGAVTISGSGRTLDDLPAFVDRLVAIPGVVDVVPGSNVVSAGTAQFNVTVQLTDQLHSHRYDAAAIGAK
jgi:hypothetical protein